MERVITKEELEQVTSKWLSEQPETFNNPVSGLSVDDGSIFDADAEAKQFAMGLPDKDAKPFVCGFVTRTN